MTIKPTTYATAEHNSEREMVLTLVDAHNTAYDRHRSVSNRPLRVLEFLNSVPEKPLDHREFDPTFMPLADTGAALKVAPCAYLMHMKDQTQAVHLKQLLNHGSAVLRLVQYGILLENEYDKIANAFNAVALDCAATNEIVDIVRADLECIVGGRRPAGPKPCKTPGFKVIYDFYVHGFHTYHWKDVYKATQALHIPI